MKRSAQYNDSGNTEYKQEGLRHILSKTFAIIGAIRHKAEWARRYSVVYFDLYAGPGRTSAGEPGSPLVFLDAALPQPYPIWAHLFEKDYQTGLYLACELAKYERPATLICEQHWDDNKEVVRLLPEKLCPERFGLAYVDPSNANLLEAVEPLRRIIGAYPRVDIIVNYAAASWKRVHKLDYYRCLLEVLGEIPKQRWLIRKPIGKFQWTMLFGTNYLGFSADENRAWYDIETDMGKWLLERVSYTNDERNDESGQMPLPGVN